MRLPSIRADDLFLGHVRGSARIPGPLGRGIYSGRTLSARPQLLAGPPVSIARKAIRQIGKRFSKLATKKARSRILGHLLRRSRAWKKAFLHIADHFNPALVYKKIVHTVFKEQYRTQEAVEKLVREVASKPERAARLSKATNLDGVADGIPVVILEKRIGEIGTKQVLKRNAVGEYMEITTVDILRVIVDYTGRPITAYPVEAFFAGGLVVAAALTVPEIEEAYAAEESAREEEEERFCDSLSIIHPWIDWLIADATCLGREHNPVFVDKRAEQVLGEIEQELGSELDSETREHVREDVRLIWGIAGPFTSAD